MWAILGKLAVLLGAAASATSLVESASRAGKRAAERKRLKRGIIMPRDAARELERRIGGRVAVGKKGDRVVLVIMRLSGPRSAVPAKFDGYPVVMRPQHDGGALGVDEPDEEDSPEDDAGVEVDYESSGLVVIGRLR